MKLPKVKFHEQTESIFEDDFSDRRISRFGDSSELENLTDSQHQSFLNDLLSLVKLIFFYIPGAIAIHFVGLFMYFFILFRFDVSELFSGMITGLLTGMFLTMFGIGKMNDLRYLKVPAAIFAGSLLMSIVFALITGLTGARLTGFLLVLSFPLTIILGYLVKRFLDNA